MANTLSNVVNEGFSESVHTILSIDITNLEALLCVHCCACTQLLSVLLKHITYRK